MFGGAPFGSLPFGDAPDSALALREATPAASITISSIYTPDRSLLLPDRRVAQGTLIRAASSVWVQMARQLGQDWSQATQLTPTQWEEMVAGAFKVAGFDEVILTPRSGDRGRDVIAIKRGVGSVKILGSVKAYSLGHLVTHDEVRALVGVLGTEPDASKGILATTSRFQPLIAESEQFKPLMPTRLELMDGPALQSWLIELSKPK